MFWLKVINIVNKSFLFCLAMFLFFGVSSVFAEEAEQDSVQVVQPTFSMTPT